MRFQRCRMLLGEEAFEGLTRARILILGVGGVGSYALDCLYRSGVRNITVVDHDTYEESNLNRQIGAEGAVGEYKVDTLARLYPGITPLRRKMDLQWVEEFDFEPYDLVIDAADTTRVKIEIARRCHDKLLMSLGSAKRIDASRIRTGSIWESRGDALARKIRSELRRSGFAKDFTVVFSDEEPRCADKGSFVGVTGSFGLTLCSLALQRLLSSQGR